MLGVRKAGRDLANILREIQQENDRLKAENDRLREVVSDGEENARLILHESRVLQAENAKLREACAELLKMAESSDPEWLHWPEMHDELRELGVKIVKF